MNGDAHFKTLIFYYFESVSSLSHIMCLVSDYRFILQIKLQSLQEVACGLTRGEQTGALFSKYIFKTIYCKHRSLELFLSRLLICSHSLFFQQISTTNKVNLINCLPPKLAANYEKGFLGSSAIHPDWAEALTHNITS